MDKNGCTCVCLYCGTIVSLGVLIGWGVSMATECGTFDVNEYTLREMEATNCTVPATTPHCSDIYHYVRRSANDLALQRCFVYCWDGIVYGLLFAGFSLLLVACVQHRFWVREQWSRVVECCTKNDTVTSNKVRYEMRSPPPPPEITYEVDYIEFKN